MLLQPFAALRPSIRLGSSISYSGASHERRTKSSLSALNVLYPDKISSYSAQAIGRDRSIG